MELEQITIMNYLEILIIFKKLISLVSGIIHLKSITGSHTKLMKLVIVSNKIIILEIVFHKITIIQFMEV